VENNTAHDIDQFKQALEGNSFFKAVFNALPSWAFIVDEDVRILAWNEAAARSFGDEGNMELLQWTGDAIQCINATQNPLGCGRSQQCRACIIRNAVTEALNNKATYRKLTHMTVRVKGIRSSLSLQVTAVPITYKSNNVTLIILEDVTELLQLRNLLPICSYCKKIRDDNNYWQSVEQYFTEHLDVQFTHGICPDCLQKFYPSITEKR